MEGAIWMGRRMTNEIERVCQSFETLSQEYIARFKEIDRQMSTHESLHGTNARSEIEVLQMQRA